MFEHVHQIINVTGVTLAQGVTLRVHDATTDTVWAPQARVWTQDWQRPTYAHKPSQGRRLRYWYIRVSADGNVFWAKSTDGMTQYKPSIPMLDHLLNMGVQERSDSHVAVIDRITGQRWTRIDGKMVETRRARA